MTLIKSISGIRGTIGGAVGDNLTPLDLVRFVSAYCKWLGAGRSPKRLRVVLGRDARISGEMVASVVEGTLTGCGVDVVNIGLATTPTTEMAVTGFGADGGIILTASHNPKQWNALKLLGPKGEFLNAADGAEVLRMAEAEDFDYADVDSLGHAEHTSYDKEHIDAVLALPLVDVDAVRAAGLKAVVDGVDSVGGVVIPKLLERMGVETIRLNCEPTGHFSHNPEPIPANLTQIAAAVPANGAAMGIVVDPDVDRLALVSEDGSMFGEEYTLVAVADYILSHTPGATVSNLSSSRALADITASYGCTYSAAAVGEVNVVAKMKETGAVIGGEGNGGVIYPPLHYGRDALAGVALFLTHYVKRGLPMTALRATYPDYSIVKSRIELTPSTDVDAILEAVREHYSLERITDIDGVKIDFADGWVHLRKSNTEPIIRIYSEAGTEQRADELALGVKRVVEAM